MEVGTLVPAVIVKVGGNFGDPCLLRWAHLESLFS
jgi:hypothetical protein